MKPWYQNMRNYKTHYLFILNNLQNNTARCNVTKYVMILDPIFENGGSWAQKSQFWSHSNKFWYLGSV